MKSISNKENLLQQTEAISRNIEIKKQSIAKMAATAASLKDRAAEFSMSTDMADSRTAYAISLYAKISNITWDYSINNGKLGGCKYISIVCVLYTTTFYCAIYHTAVYILLYCATDTVLYTYIVVLLFYHYYQLPHQ